MNEQGSLMETSFFVHLLVAFFGVLAGTALSAPVNGLALHSGDYLVLLLLSPLEMTVGIPIVFWSCSPLTGTLMVLGAVGCIASLVCGTIRPRVWTLVAVFLGAALWSLGNAAVCDIFMGV